jgi:hypothetical protein
MTEPKYTFFLESKPNKTGEHLIFFNMSYGFREYNVKTGKYKYLPLKLSTGYRIKKEDFDNEIFCGNATYVKKKGNNLNNVLAKIKATSIEQLQLFENEHHRLPTNEELKTEILLKLGKTKDTSKDIRITKYISDTVTSRTAAEITSENRWSKATGKQYTNLKNHIKNYETSEKTVLSFGKLTGEIFMDFFKVINELNKKETSEFYAHNTIAKENKHFRAILSAAQLEDIKIGFNHIKKEYKINRRDINNEIVFNTEHLTTIINTDVSASREFTHARNYILLSSFTGLRIGDMVCLHELEPKNLQHNSTNYFCFTTKIRKNKENKNELTVVLPILDPIKNFLKDNDNNFPTFPAQANIRKDITKFLKHLKFEDIVDIRNYYYMIDDAVISKQKLCDVFSPHDCRSTFITNLKELGIADETIEPLTHPKHKKTSIVQTYDKTKLVQKAVDLIRILNDKGSELYKY